MCAAFVKTNNAQTVMRNEELVVLSKVREILDSKVGDEGEMNADVRERGV